MPFATINIQSSSGSKTFAEELPKKYSKLASRLAKTMVPIMKKRYYDLGFFSTGAYERNDVNEYTILIGDERTVNQKGQNYGPFIEEGRGPYRFVSPGIDTGKFTVPRGIPVTRDKYPAAKAGEYALKIARDDLKQYIERK